MAVIALASGPGLTSQGGPAVEYVLPPTNVTVRALDLIEVHFTEPVLGVEAGDLLINDVPATNVTEVAPGAFVFEFAPPGVGGVEVRWANEHGIASSTLPPVPFIASGWGYQIDPNAVRPDIRITEFLAENNHGLKDEDGSRPDWLELHNAGAQGVDLGGWFLTDNILQPDKWRLPAVTLAGGGYLVVFASEKNRTNPIAPARLHTNFKLDNDGEYLALVTPLGEVISEFAPNFPAQQPDVSYGRDRLQPGLLGYYPTPTPGSANSSTGAGFAPEVIFARAGGTFSGSFSLALSTPVSNAVIRYVAITSASQASASLTNVPTSNSTIYAGPLAVSGTTQIRARAFLPGLFPGPTRTETFVEVEANYAANFSSDLPLIILHNFGAGSVPATSDQTAIVLAFEGGTNRTRLSQAPVLATRGGINIRGSSTQGYPKSSFAVELWDEFNQDKKAAFFNLPAESDWVLYAPNDFEPVLMHNPFFYKMSREIGRYAPRTRFVEVFVKTSSGPITSAHYNGVYVLEEKIKQGNDRVDINSLQPEDNTPPEVTGGYLFKTDRRDADEYSFNGAGQDIIVMYPKNMTLAQPDYSAHRAWLNGYFSSFESTLFGANWTHPANGYAQYIDVDSWIDHMLINVTCFNVDAVRLSGYYFKDREKPIEMGPVWDCDRGLGSTDGRDENPRVWSARRGTDFFRDASHWYGRVFADTNFFQRYIDRYQTFRAGPMSTSNLLATIDAYVAELAEAQPREQAKWGSRAPPRKADGSNGGTYATEVQWLKNWLTNRLHFMDTNFLALPRLSRAGGSVVAGTQLSFSHPGPLAGTTLYYTTNGVDPRGFNGAIASGAAIYSGPITLNHNVRIVARARNAAHRNLTGSGNPQLSSPWSGPVAATYYTRLPELIVTEIMYHPAPAPPPSADNADDFEFIELKNVGSNLLELAGIHFSKGIAFTFTATSGVTRLAPGGYVLVVKSPAHFAARYPGITNVAGTFAGNLDNNGEGLRLEGALDEPILDFTYDDGWEPASDGDGWSLVAVPEATGHDWSSPGSWRQSSRAHGSPGIADAPLDSDGDGMPDTWEVANGTAPLVADGHLDSDNDGLTNYEEYLAGTNPQSGSSALKVGISLAGSVQLRFQAISNRNYRVEHRASFATGSWQTLANVSASATNRTVTVSDPAVPTQRVYRLLVP